MKEICKKHIEDLHQKITKITTNDRSSQTLIEWIEGCFIVSEKAWAQLKEELERHKFENKQEEIWFFRSMKPQFTGLIEYFTLLYRAELFVPNEAAAFILFWQQELERIQCFFDKNASFYAYFKSGETHHDNCYFLRRAFQPEASDLFKLYDVNSRMITTHDHLVASIIAMEKFKSYINQRLSETIKNE